MEGGRRQEILVARAAGAWLGKSRQTQASLGNWRGEQEILAGDQGYLLLGLGYALAPTSTGSSEAAFLGGTSFCKPFAGCPVCEPFAGCIPWRRSFLQAFRRFYIDQSLRLPRQA